MIPIVHVHGRLPELPSEPFNIDRPGTVYPNKTAIDWTKSAAAAINVVLEMIDDQTQEATREATRHAYVMCFLGFAYDPENLRRLQLKKPLSERACQKFGSAFGLMAGEQMSVQRRIPDIVLGSHTQSCRDVLRGFDIFSD